MDRMETDCLMGRMGTEPILSVKWSVSIGIMVNFDGDGDGYGYGDGTCKQTLIDDNVVHNTKL